MLLSQDSDLFPSAQLRALGFVKSDLLSTALKADACRDCSPRSHGEDPSLANAHDYRRVLAFLLDSIHTREQLDCAQTITRQIC